MRPLWKGGITFGLIYIPVKLYSATQAVQLDLDMLSKQDKSPIRYARINTKTGEEVAWKDIVKGYEHKKGNYVVLEPSDFEKVDMEKSQNIEITSFVDLDEIDPIYFDKPFYIEPDGKSAKVYALLREALRKTNKAGVAEFVQRNREHLCIIKPEGNLLVLNQLRYEDEVRPTKDLDIPGKSTSNEKEEELAMELIEKMTDKFDISDYQDDYIAKLKKLIDAKAKRKTFKVEEPEERREVEASDIAAQLRESLIKFRNA
jgi:DNA end-binding protein Ku